MIAALPMYDRAETAGALDRLWAGVRDRLRDAGHAAPASLTRGGDPWDVWRDPDLVLGQTCGLPYRAHLHDRVQLLGGGDWDLPATPPGHYHSVIVTCPGADIAQAVGAGLAINDRLSQSGWAAPTAWAASRGLAFAHVVETGGHRASVRAVAGCEAGIAAIDAVTWRGIERFEPGLAAALAVRDRTAPTPGLPFIAGPNADAAAVAAALSGAIADLDAADRAALGLHAFVPMTSAIYLAEPIPAAPGESRTA